MTNDQHFNSTIGLCPPAVELDDGGTYRASPAQRWLWRNWLTFWEWVDERAKHHRADRIIALFNGDVADTNKHSKHQLITPNETTIVRIAVSGLGPALDVADDLIFVRGTEAHDGESGCIEEKIAEDLGGCKATGTGNWSWWYYQAELSGIKIDAAHHPQTAGWRPWTERAAAARQSAIVLMNYTKRDWEIPDLAFFGHVHYFADSGIERKPRAFYNWGWQLTTSFGHRLGGGGPSVRPVGGILAVCADGEYVIETRKFEPQRRQRWTPPK